MLPCYVYILLVTCMHTTHIPGVGGSSIEDGATADVVGVKPGGKHPASSISEQQSPKL